VTAYLSLSLPAPEISAFEVINASRMDGPKVAFPVSGSAGFNKAIVEREIVPDGVSPAGSAVSKVREVVQYVLVDVSQHQLVLLGAEDGHGDETDVRVLRLRLVRNSEETRIKFSVSVSKVHRMRSVMRWWRRWWG